MNRNNARRILAVLSAALMLALPACNRQEAASDPVQETATVENAAAESSCTGTVTAISADSITITDQVGTEQTIPLTGDTVFTRGGMDGGAAGDAPDGQPPKLPDQNGSSDTGGGQPPEAPEGENPADASGAPEGDAQPPQQQGEQAPPTEDGQTAPEDGETPPEKPEGGTQPGGQPEALTYESVQVGIRLPSRWQKTAAPPRSPCRAAAWAAPAAVPPSRTAMRR